MMLESTITEWIEMYGGWIIVCIIFLDGVFMILQSYRGKEGPISSRWDCRCVLSGYRWES